MKATRAREGETSLRNSSHLPPIDASRLTKPVMLPPGRARLATNPLPTGSETTTKTMGRVLASRATAAVTGVACATDQFGSCVDELFRQPLHTVHIGGREAVVDPDVAALDPSQLLEAAFECIQERGCLPVILGRAHEHADVPHPLALRARHANSRRCRRRAADERYELAPPHSITSSARCRNGSGTVRPSAFAVFRLITSSNLVGCCTGRSAGLAPLRTRSM